MTLPFDAYSLRARLFPALIATAPAMTLIATLVTWSQFHVSQFLATLALGVLLFAFSDFARRQGKRVQPTLFPPEGTMPSTVMLRHRDATLHADVKQRILAFVGGKLKQKPPTSEEETASPRDADSFYSRAVAWLREHTREKTFKVLLEENITYGFRRNLLGMKSIGLALSAVTVVLAAAATYYRYRLDPTHDPAPFTLILVVAAIHALYFCFVVTPRSVTTAADTYARQLFYSAELLMTPVPRAATTKAKA